MSKEKYINSSIAVVSFLFAKAGKLFYVIKSLKYAKYVLTIISMALSSLLYGFAYGSWAFAIGLVLLIFVHEMGHVIAMMKKGMKTSAPVFIPFLGAAVFCEPTKDRDKEAYIGYGGPLIGTIGAVACILFAISIEGDLKTATIFHLLGNVGLMINLFNLIPARPLDGGRILYILGDKMIYIGVPILLYLAFITQDVFLIVISLIAAYDGKIVSGRLALFMVGLCSLYEVFLLIFFPLSVPWVDVVIVLSLTTFTVICFYSSLFFAKGEIIYEELEETDDISKTGGLLDCEENRTTKNKIKWVVCYIVIVVGLFALMAWHSQYLPKEVREHSVVHFVS